MASKYAILSRDEFIKVHKDIEFVETVTSKNTTFYDTMIEVEGKKKKVLVKYEFNENDPCVPLIATPCYDSNSEITKSYENGNQKKDYNKQSIALSTNTLPKDFIDALDYVANQFAKKQRHSRQTINELLGTMPLMGNNSGTPYKDLSNPDVIDRRLKCKFDLADIKGRPGKKSFKLRNFNDYVENNDDTVTFGIYKVDGQDLNKDNVHKAITFKSEVYEFTFTFALSIGKDLNSKLNLYSMTIDTAAPPSINATSKISKAFLKKKMEKDAKAYAKKEQDKKAVDEDDDLPSDDDMTETKSKIKPNKPSINKLDELSTPGKSADKKKTRKVVKKVEDLTLED